MAIGFKEENSGNDKPKTIQTVPRQENTWFAPTTSPPSKVKNEDLNQALGVLNNPLSTEQQKIDALNTVKSVFTFQSPTLTQNDTDLALQAIRFAALQNASASQNLKVYAADTAGCIFNSNAPLSSQNLRETLPQLKALLDDSSLSEEARTRAAYGICSGLYASVRTPAFFLTLTETTEYINSSLSIASNSSFTDAFREAGLRISSMVVKYQYSVLLPEHFQQLSQVVNGIIANSALSSEFRMETMNILSSMFNSQIMKPAFFVNDSLLALKNALEESGASVDFKYQAGTTMSIIFHPAGTIESPSAQVTRSVLNSIMSALDACSGSSGDENLKKILLVVSSSIFDCSSHFSILTTSETTNALSHVVPYLQVSTESEQIIKMAMHAITSAINQVHLQFSSLDFNAFLATSEQIISNSAASQELKASAGGIIANACFCAPELLDVGEYHQLFNLDSQTARRMAAESPDWTDRWYAPFFGLFNLEMDFKAIYSLAKNNPGQPIIKTLFETSNVTYFGNYPQNVLERQFYNSNQLTGQQVLLVATTKHRGGIRFGSFLGNQDYLSKFDVRIIEPGSDEKLARLVKSNADRLGIKTKTEEPNGLKINFFVVAGHGAPESVMLKPKEVGDTFLDIGDKDILKRIEPYLAADAQGFLYACSTAGVSSGNINILEFTAKYLRAQFWGPQIPAHPPSVSFDSLGNGKWRISRVDFVVPTTSCDYANVGSLNIPTNSISRNGNDVQISWTCQNASNTLGYEIERSVDGADFEKAGFVSANNQGSYSFTDSQAPSEKAYYRIKQVNMDLIGTNGSNAYTYSVSQVYNVSGATSVIGGQKLTKFGLQQNYPNPFNTTTKINYSIPKNQHVTLKVYDILGREVSSLVDGEVNAGNHMVNFDATKLASGTYFCRLEAGANSVTKKMSIIK